MTDPKSRVRPSRVAVTGLLDRVSVRNFDIRPSITLLKAAGVLGHTHLIMHEIVTLQMGQRANYLATHFWNLQVVSVLVCQMIYV